jgi:hypothetical protein
MNPRLNAPPEADALNDALDVPSSGCAALAAVSPLAARTVLRACRAWDLLEASIQTSLLRRVSGGPVEEAAAARAALAALMESAEWKAGRFVQKAALERLATLTSPPTWFARITELRGRH